MARLKGKGIVISALVAGAASYLSKKNNREKAIQMISNIFGSKTDPNYDNNSLKEIAETPASTTNQRIRENNFVGEGGAQTALAYYNESNQQPYLH
ncbi:hypothetical protein SAMN05880501_110115 [Ureibacillus xyleni]|uniref:Uncharacterized protein n=1 Tax=Ureibacillus xyleni TaxID=614648 RepID=A0A285TB64_9BACL|nr:hypothetical protein [Ureibacillus xyleni]SOC18482.1 hypothetical protein SAMN05880501_110115 [Ureibacillus xyleni]